jgi:Glycosyl hydrolases family 2, sugar binding domain/Glycosyl hydrolases family 2
MRRVDPGSRFRLAFPWPLFPALWFLSGAGLAMAAAPALTISLAGQWRFSLDSNNQGVQEEYFNRDLPEHISLPGSTDEARFGKPNPSKPSLDGLFRLYVYEGRAWFQRDVEIPASWRGKQIVLFLERSHWDTRVWVDSRFIGTRDSLIAPHVYDLGMELAPGKHRLTICVDNTKKIDLGRFVSINYEGTQTNWNGLIGRLELRAKDPISISDVEVYSDVARKLARVRVTISNMTGRPATGELTIGAAVRQGGGRVPSLTTHFSAAEPSATVTVALPMGADVRLWDEFSPTLYELSVSMNARTDAGSFGDSENVVFGMRDFATRGTQFTLNGRTIFLRGTLECAIFPRTGYPRTDVESWRRIYRIIKVYGLNHMRFHSWCPPDAAFTAADQEGILIQAEGPQANVQAGRDATRDAFLEQEMLRMVHTYGNHPSFVMMTPGNEFGGPMELMTRWVDMLIKEDPRHLYSSASNNNLITPNRQFTVSSRPRGVQGVSTAVDFSDAVSRQDRPLVGHEIGQWTFYPNFDEIQKYNGVLAAKNFELIRDDLAAKHLLDLAPRIVQATGRQAVLLYKEEMEILLRTPGHAGFALLDLHDYPGQGTALIGILDPFWDSKGFITPHAHRRYAGPTVPLLRMPKRTYIADEPFHARVEVAHFGPADLPGAQPQWTIRDEQGHEVASGSMPARVVPTGKLTSLGSFDASFVKVAAPAKLNISVSLQGTEFANDWDIWVYPSDSENPVPPGILVARNWPEARKALEDGRKVLLFPATVNPVMSRPGKFLPVFWSSVWFPNRQPSTMGILCDPKHPALAQFPTEFYSNWQWYELIQNSRTMILDSTPATFRPVIQVIDTFERNGKLGNLFEARVGKGRLLVCTMDLPGLAEKQPAAKQLARSLYAYLGSSTFNPTGELAAPLLERMFSVAGSQ